jgi:signal transduction histidine kinase
MPERILIVDDEPFVGQLLEEKLRKEGYWARAVQSAQEATKEIQRAEYGLVLTDVRMEGMDGIALTREVKARSPDTEVILVTAVADIQVAVTATRVGAADYITKPFNLEQMLVSVRGALEHRWLKLERRRYQKDLQLKVRERTRLLREKDATLSRLQDEMSNMEKLSSIGVLAASVSHEVNNPLSSMIGFAELIAEMENVPEDARKYARVIFLEGQKIHKLTEQLLDISRQGKAEKQIQDLNQVVREVLTVTDHHLSRYENVEIEEELHPEALVCCFDRGQVQQILLNLFLNAAQAMPEGGKLTVRSFRETREDLGPGMGFSVSDTGQGIPEEVREKIFKPFYTTKEKGTGLGLKICQDIVRGHGGTIDLESEPGKGTTFRVWVPTGETEALHEPEKEPAACRG